MKVNNRFIFGVLSLVLAAIIAFVALPTIARQTNGKTEIVRITQPVLKANRSAPTMQALLRSAAIICPLI